MCQVEMCQVEMCQIAQEPHISFYDGHVPARVALNGRNGRVAVGVVIELLALHLGVV